MINLDFVEELLHEQMRLKKIKVKGVTDSGWFLDRTPFTPTNKPAVDAIRKGMDLWQGRVPRRCREQYLSEPWRCYFGYRIYPTLKGKHFSFLSQTLEHIFFQPNSLSFNGFLMKLKWTLTT